MNLQPLPIGTSDFSALRSAGQIYVDKTEFVYELASERQKYFLARPRGMLQNSTFVGLALPLFLIAFFGYLVWLQFFSLLKPVNYSFSRRFLECFRY